MSRLVVLAMVAMLVTVACSSGSRAMDPTPTLYVPPTRQAPEVPGEVQQNQEINRRLQSLEERWEVVLLYDQEVLGRWIADGPVTKYDDTIRWISSDGRVQVITLTGRSTAIITELKEDEGA